MVAAPHKKEREQTRYSIGQVLEKLAGDFPDLTPSKLRFLEEQGLITPERTTSGYRKFTQAHIERLRLILTLQRDYYLPLKKISEVLADAGNSRTLEIPGAGQRSVASILGQRQLLSRTELAHAAGVKPSLVAEAISAGLLPSAEVFPVDLLVSVSAIGQLAERGLTPRHLRALRLAAEKEADSITHAVSARLGKKVGPAHHEEALLLAELFDTVRSGVVRQRLKQQR